jgi:hypothetical protein
VRQLRRYGDNTLLWVVEEPAGERGRAYWLDEGLIRGNVDRLARTDIEKDISLDSWIEMCDRAVRIWKKRRGERLSARKAVHAVNGATAGVKMLAGA